MNSKWTIGKKLIASFLSVAAVTAVLGFVGYYGVNQAGIAINELGSIRLPSIESMLVVSEGQTAVDTTENALLSRAIHLNTRQQKYEDFAAIWKRIETAWKVYEPLPQTDEEAATWQKFVPAWNAWKKDHEEYVRLSKEYDKYVEGQFNADAAYKEMINQALVVNGVSFGKSESLLNEIASIYTDKAQTDQSDESFDRVAFLTIQSLLTMSEAQTAVDCSENALLCRDIDMTMRKSQYERIAGAWQRVEDSWKIYEPLEQTPQEKVLWSRFVPAWNAWKKDHQEYVRLSKEYDQYVEDGFKADECYAKMTNQALVLNGVSFGASETLLNRIVTINSNVGAKVAEESKTQAAFLKAVAVVSLAVGVVLAIGLGVIISRGINKALSRIVEALTDGSDQVASASGQVSSASQSLAEGATEQAAGLEETSSSLEEMSTMTRQNADNAQQANTLASDARKAADNGAESMTRMNTAIQDIQKSSEETAKIIKVIDEIAFQTNLLALNAAVEAARAGEAGKGFAVVAEEVRNLAMRSAEAAKNTSSMIEESVKNSNNGVDIAGEVGKVLDEIVQGVGKTTDLVGEIATASQEQAQGIDQVNTAVSQMDKVTQQNAANAEESASASEELSAQAEQMNQIVSELIAMVGGSTAKRSASTSESLGRSVAGKTDGLRGLDRTFHQIASDSGPDCWDVKKCGRTPGGSKVDEFGICPAYPESGKSCWKVVGTFCGGKVQGSAAQKRGGCLNCNFYKDRKRRTGNVPAAAHAIPLDTGINGF